jgi:DNA-binding response OmpR family regulator
MANTEWETPYLGVEGGKPEDHYRDAHLDFDFARARACLDGRELTLTRKEYELLSLLMHNAGEIVPRDVLLMNVWGYGREIRTRTLDVHVRRLRKKLGGLGERYIETIFGIGYRFQPYREQPRFQPYAAAMAAAAF